MPKYILLSLIFTCNFVQAGSGCSFKKWDAYQGSQLLQEKPKGAYIFATTKVKVDADGAPNAYHPDDVGLHCTKGIGFKGLDCPQNGGYPKSSWWRSAIVPDPKNNDKGYIQPDGIYKGYFVSQTSLQDRSKSNLDPTKYVNSTVIPYLVFPGKFHSMAGTGSVGDLGYALNLENGKGSPFIVADIGPSDAHLGEMSIFLGDALGGKNPNPRTGAGVPTGKIVYIVFPYSKASPSWSVPLTEINSKVTSLLRAVGGVDILKDCADTL